MPRPHAALSRPSHSSGAACLAEMQEFATFPKAAQRFIRRSLDVGLGRRDAAARWARTAAEAAEIAGQQRRYRRLDALRASIPDDSAVEAIEPVLAALASLIAHDLACGRLDGFAACRFLYERLLGAAIRPWLPAAFLAGAALPHLHPDRRRTLLQSMTEAAATAPGWSSREPAFLPEWVEKVDA